MHLSLEAQAEKALRLDPQNKVAAKKIEELSKR